MSTIDQSASSAASQHRPCGLAMNMLRKGSRLLMIWRVRDRTRSVAELSPDLWPDIAAAEDLADLQSRATRQDRVLAQAKLDASYRAIGLRSR